MVQVQKRQRVTQLQIRQHIPLKQRHHRLHKAHPRQNAHAPATLDRFHTNHFHRCFCRVRVARHCINDAARSLSCSYDARRNQRINRTQVRCVFINVVTYLDRHTGRQPGNRRMALRSQVNHGCPRQCLPCIARQHTRFARPQPNNCDQDVRVLSHRSILTSTAITNPGVKTNCRLKPAVRALTLGVSRRLARPLETHLLAFLLARIAREQTRLAQLRPQLFVDLQQRTRNRMP